MTIGAVNGVSFGEGERQRQSGGSLLPVVSAGAGALVGGLVIKEKISAKKLLTDDKFELSKDKFKNLEKEQEDAIDALNKIRADKIEPKVETEIEKIFGKNGNELTVDKFLAKVGNGKTTVKSLNATLDKLNKNVENLTAEVKTKEDALAKATKEADKTKAEKALEKVKISLEEAKAKVESTQPLKELVEGAKDGKITREAAKAKSLEGMTQEAAKSMSSAIDKLPKLKSGKMALIGGAIGLVSGMILSALFSSKSQAPES